MPPTLAQVLTTLAHELRTPVAVAQGYVTLWRNGRLDSPEDQHRAMQGTSDAMGRLAGLCAEAGRLATILEAGDQPQPPREAASRLVDALRSMPALAGISWAGACPSSFCVSTWHLTDLASAVATLIRAAVDEGRSRPTVIEIASSGDDVFCLYAGVAAELAPLAEGPDAPQAAPFDVVRGGKGLSVVSAAFILHQHHVHTWQVADRRSAVGFRIPVTVA